MSFSAATVSALVNLLRKEARPGIWSSGVNLARGGSVVVESQTEGEVVLRVRAPGRTVALSAILYPEDQSWECDCPSRVDPCEHVVAAALALQQAGSQAAPLPTAAARFARVVYRFSRAGNGLTVS